MRSIRRSLQLWMLGALALGGAVMVVVAYDVTLTEMGEQFDANLQQVALAVAEHHAFGTDYRAPTRADLPGLPKIFEEDGDFDFVTSTYSADGQLIYSSEPRLSFAHLDRTGLSEFEANGERWRVYTLVTTRGTVEVAQRASVRSLLAAATAARLAVPPICLIALVALLIDIALHRGMRPLDRLTRQIDERKPGSFEPVGEPDMPAEIAGLGAAMNGLIGRLSSTLETQRRFTADAAHGLRTPITALRLQLQLVERSDDADQRAASMRKLHAGIDRAHHMVEQLLQLSRLTTDTGLVDHGRVDLADIVRQVVIDFELEARQRGVDLGADAPHPVPVAGDPVELRVLAANLVDNALRYAPAGSIVDVRAALRGGRAMLDVVDNGPGIAADERERVFDRFFRGSSASGESGTGLGLAIVRSIADRHHASVRLGPGIDGRGLGVTVTLVALQQASLPAGLSIDPPLRSQPASEPADLQTHRRLP